MLNFFRMPTVLAPNQPAVLKYLLESEHTCKNRMVLLKRIERRMKADKPVISRADFKLLVEEGMTNDADAGGPVEDRQAYVVAYLKKEYRIKEEVKNTPCT